MQHEIGQNHTCSICLTIYFNPVYIRNCKHTFCYPCIEEATEYTDIKKCPLCRAIFKQTDLIPEPALKKQIEQFYPDELKERAKSLRERITYKLRVGNTTKVLNTQQDNKYQWRLYVEPAEGEPPLEKYADRVEVYLHPTFHPNKLTYSAKQKVELRRIGWGTFRIDIKVIWKQKYGGYTDVFHDLSFSPKKQSILSCKIIKTGQVE